MGFFGRVIWALVVLGGSAAVEAQAVPSKPPAPAAVPLSEPGPNAMQDANGDGLPTSGGLQPMENAAQVDGVSVTQSFAAVPMGTGADPAPDPEGDSDSAERTTGPANGLARGRHAGVAYVFAQQSVREFRVGGQSFSAASGGAGAVSTTLTRGGEAALHGGAFFTLRSQAFAAYDPLAIATSYQNGVVTSEAVKPHDLRERFGGSIGGPILKARQLFFFDAIEEQRRGFPAVSSPANPAFFSLTAMQTALLANRGVTPAETNAALNYVSSVTGETPRRADETVNFARLDWRGLSRLDVAVEDNLVRWQSPAGLMDAPVVARGRASIGDAAGSLDMVVLRAGARLRAGLRSESRVAWLRDLQYERPQTPLPEEAGIAPGAVPPEVNIGPEGILFGTPSTLSQQAFPDERRVELAETLTWTHGRHVVQLGGQVGFVHDQVATLANAAGTYRYDSGTTAGYAGGLVDFIADYTYPASAAATGACPSIHAAVHLACFRTFTQSFGETAVAFSTQEWAGYVEDRWSVRPGLTISGGVRYEYTLLPIPSAPNPALDAIFSARGATSVFPEDRNNLGPRAAVAWEPLGTGRGVVRAWFGMYFGRLPGATIQAALSDTAQAGTTTRIRIRPSTETLCPQTPASGFAYGCAFVAPPTGVAAATTSAVLFDRRFRLPVVEQGSLGLERQLPRGTTVSLTYTVNLDRQLPGSTDLNIAPATSQVRLQLQGGTGRPGVADGESFVLPLYTARVSPGYGPVTDVVSDVNATYHGVTGAVRSRPLKALEVQAELTWSKAIDFGQSGSAIPRTNGQLDPFSNRYDKGLSALNFPLAFRAQAVWRPILRGATGWIARAANGWGLTPVVVARSGRPYSFDLSGGTSLAGGHESLNGSGGALYLPTVGRNTLRLPATVNADLRAERGWQTGRRLRVEAAAEVFNLLNHRNVTSVEQRAYLVGTAVGGVTPLVFQSAAEIALEGLNTPAFGAPTATGSSLARERQMQFGVRLEF